MLLDCGCRLFSALADTCRTDPLDSVLPLSRCTRITASAFCPATRAPVERQSPAVLLRPTNATSVIARTYALAELGYVCCTPNSKLRVGHELISSLNMSLAIAAAAATQELLLRLPRERMLAEIRPPISSCASATIVVLRHCGLECCLKPCTRGKPVSLLGRVGPAANMSA
eukprot:1626603-Pleurochrysis_carterae.AAC.2